MHQAQIACYFVTTKSVSPYLSPSHLDSKKVNQTFLLGSTRPEYISRTLLYAFQPLKLEFYFPYWFLTIITTFTAPFELFKH